MSFVNIKRTEEHIDTQQDITISEQISLKTSVQSVDNSQAMQFIKRIGEILYESRKMSFFKDLTDSTAELNGYIHQKCEK